jgi:hypothetical protein
MLGEVKLGNALGDPVQQLEAVGVVLVHGSVLLGGEAEQVGVQAVDQGAQVDVLASGRIAAVCLLADVGSIALPRPRRGSTTRSRVNPSRLIGAGCAVHGYRGCDGASRVHWADRRPVRGRGYPMAPPLPRSCGRLRCSCGAVGGQSERSSAVPRRSDLALASDASLSEASGARCGTCASRPPRPRGGRSRRSRCSRRPPAEPPRPPPRSRRPPPPPGRPCRPGPAQPRAP